ncbi:hypothetical protein DPMN_152292 [Dreissena polymorpha]|uniref:Uncharacterized protein n=1 Tax=Dreissena polymorpha TaxID=45954 RepID=A0A9D4FLJ7_DREPO|nr:hypothetical protein DPMN_152292 [Dreissena polymorpha]
MGVYVQGRVHGAQLYTVLIKRLKTSASRAYRCADRPLLKASTLSAMVPGDGCWFHSLMAEGKKEYL